MKSLSKLIVKNFNIEKFQELLNQAMMVKLSSNIESSIMFKINKDQTSVQAALDTKSGIKFCSMYSQDLFDPVDEDFPELHLPFDDGKNLLSALKLFSPGVENKVAFEYLEIDKDGEDIAVVDNIKINEGGGKILITIKCVEFGDVIFVPEAAEESLTSEDDALGILEINESVMKKMLNMFALDSDYSDVVAISCEGSNAYLVGNNYKYTLCDFYKGADVKVKFQKDHMSFVDKGYHTMIIHENRLILKSKLQDYTTVISLVQED